MRKAALLYNPDSGGSKHRQRELDSALAILRRGGVEADLVPTKSPDHAEDETRHAIDDGCDTIFACGGDGTIHNIAQALANTSTTLGILPIGTANALAHDIHLPLKVVDAARAALQAAPGLPANGVVALVDDVTTLGDADVALDLMGDHTLADVALNIDRLDLQFLRRSLSQHACGLSLLPHPVQLEDASLIREDHLQRVIGLLRASYTHLVLDLSKSFSPTDVTALRMADLILLVAQLDLSSLRNVVRMMATLDMDPDIGPKVRIVINRVGNESDITVKQAEETAVGGCAGGFGKDACQAGQGFFGGENFFVGDGDAEAAAGLNITHGHCTVARETDGDAIGNGVCGIGTHNAVAFQRTDDGGRTFGLHGNHAGDTVDYSQAVKVFKTAIDAADDTAITGRNEYAVRNLPA